MIETLELSNLKIMKIKNIKVYKVDIPLKEGSYKWAHNNHVEKFDTSIVVIETDNNILGLGEVCTLGSSYLPAYSKGVRSGKKNLKGTLMLNHLLIWHAGI